MEEPATAREVRHEAVRRELAERGRPSEPWVPWRVQIHPVGRAKETKRAERTILCWDVRGTIDGWPYFKRFSQPHGSAEKARDWAKKLVADFGRGWMYDPQAKRFVEPETRVDIEGDRLSVLDAALDQLDRKWRSWEPKSREAAVRSYRRACLHLVDDPEGRPEDAVEAYLDAVMQSPLRRPATLTELEAEGERWIQAASLSMDKVTWQQLEDLVRRYRISQRDPTKTVSAVTERRFVADLKHLWRDCGARHAIANPWPAVHTLDKDATRRGSVRPGPVDKDIVLSPSQVLALADACVEYGSWGEEVRAYVEVLGLCGLRPGEGAALGVDDLDLPRSGTGWLRVSRSARRVSSRWLDDDEDEQWGPLKDRAIGESRTVPVPEAVVRSLRHHLETVRRSASNEELIFTHGGHRFDMGAFERDVWEPARRHLFPSNPKLKSDDPRQSKLSRLRRHDLRHAACSMWLNAGVDPKVCQKWSGHSTLSVFLDVYQGINPGREELGAELVEDFLVRQMRADLTSPAGP